MKINKEKEGFMVVEVLIAASIIAICVLAATTMVQKSVFIARQAFHTTQAGFLLEEGAETVRIIRDNNWTNISSLTTGADYYLNFSAGTWTLSLTPSTIGIFTRTVRIGAVNRDDSTKDISSAGTNDVNTKMVTVNVAWEEGGVSLSKNIQFYVMNIFP